MMQKKASTNTSIPLLEGWIGQESFFTSTEGGVRLFRREWRRETGGTRALVIFHGMGEHGGRYARFPAELADQVDLISVHDHRGHGRSEGIRGDCRRLDELVEDGIAEILRVHRALASGGAAPKLHLLGHSLGGLLALRAALGPAAPGQPALPLASVIASAPFLALHPSVPYLKKVGALALSKVVPRLPLGTGLDASLLSHDEAEVAAYRADPLVHGKMTPRFFASLLRVQKETREDARAFAFPLQMIVPLADQVVDSRASIRFYQEVAVAERGLAAFEGMYHEPWNESRREEPFGVLRKWIMRESSREK